MGVTVVPCYGNSFQDKMYINAIFGGLKTTLKNFTRNISDINALPTQCYPEQLPEDITSRYRGVHRLTHRHDGSIACVACYMCATACPAGCINIVAMAREDDIDEKMPELFNIDLLECVFCGYCVEACPCDAIRMDSGIFALTAKSREEFVYTKEKLLSIEGAFGTEEEKLSRAK